ncbi:hypothetical protein Emed_004617 [Eimeria media]
MDSDPVLTIKSADELVAIHITRQRTLNQSLFLQQEQLKSASPPSAVNTDELHAALGSEPARPRQTAAAEKGESIAEPKRDLAAKQAGEAVGRRGRPDAAAGVVETNAASTAPQRQNLLLAAETSHRSRERGTSSSRAGSAATRATRGSEAADLSSDVGDASIRHPVGYQSWYGGLIGLVFKHWVHTSCCETEANPTTPLSSKNFQERASVNPQVLLRRSSRSRTLAACSLQHDPLHASTVSATESPLSSSGRRRRSHVEGNTEKLLSEIAAQVESDELFYGCDDVPFEAQTERAVLALALQTPRNKKDGRGVWLLRHQHQHHITQVNLGAVAAYSNPLVKVSEVAEAQEGAPNKMHASPSPSSSAQAANQQHCMLPLPDQFTRKGPPTLSHAHVGGPPVNESEAAFHSPASYAGGPDVPTEQRGAILRETKEPFHAELHQEELKEEKDKEKEAKELLRQNTQISKILCSPPPPLLTHARLLSRLLVGKWETVLTRSDPLESLFKAFGIAYFKRVVVDKLAIPLDITLEENDMILHVVLTIPLGLRHMRMTLDGTPSVDEDPDCGTWEGVVQIGLFFE